MKNENNGNDIYTGTVRAETLGSMTATWIMKTMICTQEQLEQKL